MKKFNPAVLPYLAALAQFVQFAHAGFILGGWVVSVVGGIIGAVVSFSVAYTGSRVASVTGQKREKWVNVGTLAVLMISPLAIIAPVHYSFGILENDVWRWITSAAWVLAPDITILLDGLITGKKLVASEPKLATKPKKAKVKQVEPAFPSFACDKCSFVGGSQAALNGHQSAHKPKAYAVEFTPIENERK